MIKWYLADVIEHLFITACALSGHAGGCWLINSSPLRRVYWWAVNVRWNDKMPQHTACPLCHFDREGYVEREQYEQSGIGLVDRLERELDSGSGRTSNGGAFAQFRYDASTGKMERLA